MATPQENLARFQEIANRGLQDQLDPDKKARFDLALSRGLIKIETAEPRREEFKFRQRPLSQKLIGTGEMAMTLLTAPVTEAAAGVNAMMDMTSALVRGDDDVMRVGADTVNEFRERFSFRPKTEAGRESLQAVSAPFEAIQEKIVKPGAEAVADILTEKGLPGAAAIPTVLQTAAETFPPGLGAGRPRLIRTRAQRRAEGLEEVSRIQGSTGVDVSARARVQGGQIAESVERQTGGQAVRAQEIKQVQDELMNARAVRKEAVDTLFDQARATEAAIPSDALIDFADVAEAAVANVFTEGKPNLRRALNEIATIRDLPPNSAVKLNALSQFRERLVQNRSTNPSENRAMGILKGELDTFLDATFNADMIKGDPTSLQKWKDARKAFSEYKRDFSDNKVIKQLAEQETTPEQIKQWLINADSLGAKKEAGDVVNRIGDLIGRDSPAFASIRHEVIFDIAKPLLEPTPNLPGFVKRYDQFIRNNPTFAGAVFPDSVNAFKDLRDLVASTKDIQSPRFQVNLTKSLARTFFGHELSRGQVRIDVVSNLMGLIANAATTSRKRKIIADLLGYDPLAPVLPMSIIGAVGVTQALVDEELSQGELAK